MGLFWVFIIVPKILVAAGLCLMGYTWLVATDFLPDLILNSLALAFVVQIDELIFSVFLPARMESDLERTRFALPADDVDMNDPESGQAFEQRTVIKEYRRTACFMTFVLLFVPLFLKYQPVIPGYEWDLHRH